MKKLPGFTNGARVTFDETMKKLGTKTKKQFVEQLLLEFGNRNKDIFLITQPEVVSVITKMKL